jgi:small subunit ribosomal protein S14
MKVSFEQKLKGRGARKCRVCGNARGLIRTYELNICRRCFREVGHEIGFEKYS